MREALVVDYLFHDLFKTNTRLFGEMMHMKEVLYDVATGLIPRFFDRNEKSLEDSIIWDENEQVSELYFIQQGAVRIGFSVISGGVLGQGHVVSMMQDGRTVIGDHYVLNKQRS
jgi:hypothetical protein